MKTSSLRTTISGTLDNGIYFNAVLEIDDQCNNGHEDIHITGSYWYKGGRRIEANSCSGAIGGEIAGFNEVTKLFDAIHGCDFNGVPMHCTANMFYHLKQGQFERGTKETFKAEFCAYYRITEGQFNKLSKATTQKHFTVLFVSMPLILTHWKQQAEEAISYLEKATGDTFESKATRSNLILPDTKELDKLTKQLKDGYFSDAKVKARDAKKVKAAKKAKIEAINDRLDKKVAALSLDAKIDIALIQMFGTDDNVIYYSHRNKIVFNWLDTQYSTYRKIWTAEEVAKFKNSFKFNGEITQKKQ